MENTQEFNSAYSGRNFPEFPRRFCLYSSMPLAGFEPAIPASEQPKTHTLDRVATGVGHEDTNTNLIFFLFVVPGTINQFY
jgi:hypothetical protein